MRKIDVTKKNGTRITFTSSLTDGDALALLGRLIKGTGKLSRSRFARDLWSNSRRYDLSEKQFQWVHILVRDFVTVPEPAPAAKVAPAATVQVDPRLGDTPMPGIRALVDRALAKGSRTITMTLRASDGQQIKLRVRNGRPEVGVYVNDRRGGWLRTNGVFRTTRFGRAEPVMAALKAFDENPEDVGRSTGRWTGECCFCSRPLKTQESLAVGYGPVCAERFELPWGKVTA